MEHYTNQEKITRAALGLLMESLGFYNGYTSSAVQVLTHTEFISDTISNLSNLTPLGVKGVLEVLNGFVACEELQAISRDKHKIYLIWSALQLKLLQKEIRDLFITEGDEQQTISYVAFNGAEYLYEINNAPSLSALKEYKRRDGTSIISVEESLSLLNSIRPLVNSFSIRGEADISIDEYIMYANRVAQRKQFKVEVETPAPETHIPTSTNTAVAPSQPIDLTLKTYTTTRGFVLSKGNINTGIIRLTRLLGLDIPGVSSCVYKIPPKEAVSDDIAWGICRFIDDIENGKFNINQFTQMMNFLQDYIECDKLLDYINIAHLEDVPTLWYYVEYYTKSNAVDEILDRMGLHPIRLLGIRSDNLLVDSRTFAHKEASAYSKQHRTMGFLPPWSFINLIRTTVVTWNNTLSKEIFTRFLADISVFLHRTIEPESIMVMYDIINKAINAYSGTGHIGGKSCDKNLIMNEAVGDRYSSVLNGINLRETDNAKRAETIKKLCGMVADIVNPGLDLVLSYTPGMRIESELYADMVKTLAYVAASLSHDSGESVEELLKLISTTIDGTAVFVNKDTREAYNTSVIDLVRSAARSKR